MAQLELKFYSNTDFQKAIKHFETSQFSIDETNDYFNTLYFECSDEESDIDATEIDITNELIKHGFESFCFLGVLAST